MIFFTLQTTRGLMDENIYFFGRNLKAQLTEVEFKPQHSPQFGKTFYDIATVEEFYHWMLGPLRAVSMPSTPLQLLQSVPMY